jgi:hypothetical protein
MIFTSRVRTPGGGWGKIVAVWTVLFVTACTDPADDTGRPVSTSTPWTYEDSASNTAFDPVVAQADLDVLLAAILEVQPEPLFESYSAALDHGDEACPPVDSLESDGETVVWWYGACDVEATGVRFNGVMNGWKWDEVDLSEQEVTDLEGAFTPGYSWSGSGFEGRIDVYDSEGTFDFSCSCEAVIARGESEDGAEADDTWLAGEGELASVQLASTYDAEGRREVAAIVSLSGPGERYRGVTLDMSAWIDPGFEGVCSGATGTLGIHDSWTGEWSTSELDFDAGAGCDLCGTFGGEQLCFDSMDLVYAALGQR